MEARRPFETPLFEQAAKHFTGFIGKNDLQTIRFGIGNHFAAVKHPALKGIFSTALKLGDTLFHPLDFREVALWPICFVPMTKPRKRGLPA